MKYLIALVLCVSGLSHADECSDLGKKYTENRFRMTMGELVAISDCVHAIMAQMQRESDIAKEDRAMAKLWLKDGE